MSAIERIVIALTFVCWAASAAFADEVPPDLVEIENLDVGDSRWLENSIDSEALDQARAKAQRDTAYALGLQAGARWRYEQIDRTLESLSPQLDMIFDFQGLMLDDILLPPVVDYTDGEFAIYDPDTAQENLRAYRIRKRARIRGVPPSWRSYLIRHFKVTKKVHPAILPKTRKAREIWRAAARAGWRAGVRHAESVFSTQLWKLRRDYLGMVRYHVLASQEIMRPPILARSHVSSVHDDKLLEVDRRLYRITRRATFNDEKVWKIRLAIRDRNR